MEGNQPNNDENTKALTSMEDLPTTIIIDILSRLPIRALSCCRCVSTPWRTLTRDPILTKMHLSRASSPGVIIQAKTLKHGLKYDLYMAEPETCRSNDAVTSISTKFNRSNWQFEIVGSINGLLCLSEPLYYDPVYICNPIIGEYMTIPKSDIDTSFDIVSGFGYVEETNQYKVIRMLYVTVNDSITGQMSFKLEGEIYTIGSGEWRKLGEIPYPLRARASEAYLNGGLHWLMTDLDIGIDTSEFIGCFSVDKEEFQSIPPPSQFSLERRTSVRRFKLDLGVLGDNLCIFDNYFDEKVEIWMMKDYGVQESWTKQFVIRRPRSVEVKTKRVYFKPLKLLDSGEILMLFDSVAMVCYDPKTKIFRPLGLFGFFPISEDTEAVLHVGSLVALKDVAIHGSENGNAAVDTSLKSRNAENDESIKRRNSDIPYGIWDSTLYPIPTHEPKLDIFKHLAEQGGVLYVGRLNRPSIS